MNGTKGFDKIVGALFVAGAVIGLYFQFTYHKFLNNDTLSYINIAQLYAQGEFGYAINGYWSPLYCWMLALCELVHIPLQPACYVINFLAAGCSLYLLLKITQRYIAIRWLYCVFALYALGFLLYYAMSVLTPDLLACSCCLWFLYLVSHERFGKAVGIQCLAGAAAACMYFGKGYNFTVANVFLCGYIIWLIIKQRKWLIRSLLKTYAVFLLLSLVWITVLSVHEQKFTFATSGQFNHNLVGPDYNGEFPTEDWLLAPPFEKAYVAHINLTYLLDGHDWSPFDNGRNFKHQLLLVMKTMYNYYRLLDIYGIKTLLLLGVLALFLLNRNKIVTTTAARPSVLLLFFLIYPLFYLPMFVLARYVLISLLLFSFFTLYAVSVVWPLIPKKLVIASAAIAGVVLCVFGMRSIGGKLNKSASEYQYYQAFDRQLPQLSFLQNQRIVTDGSATLECVQLCYHLRTHYYCSWRDGQPDSLKQYKIRYLITKKEQVSFPFLKMKEKIPVNNTTLYIYEIY